ncbi:hypothetical protein M885DRAFT_614145 [Pelagophyceae sp. CCMP2097]|nr:hypothetical protein M885DRAFT_614145 [Pelagophyceae sp. CCMP2097]|mmetsp:Transcript_6298/g.20206  ORF Transcript_6298/g.20206 Transcript_6298/m.20206 type:complete len:190 (-) Transcript_6298:833-1402(-)
MAFVARPLFGGAIVAALPAAWLDASDVRPVPDNQEVWMEDGGGGRSVVVEVVQRADVADDAAAQYYFVDLAEDGGALEARLDAHGPVDVPKSGADAVFAAIGVQRLVKIGAIGSHEVVVGMVVLRYAAELSDIVVTVHAPAPDGATGATALRPDSVQVLNSPQAGAIGMEALAALLATFVVVDRQFFNG